jgi:uncharacterized repeat protein (TIGR01451 family)
MKNRGMALLLATLAVLLAVVALGWGTVPVSAGPSAQITLTPRPKLTPVPGDPGSAGAAGVHPPRLRGTIFDWGKGNMPAGVQVFLSGDGWQVPAVTNELGEYVFQDIGNEVAVLSAYVPDNRRDLTVLASDLPVRLQVDRELIVNMAFYPHGAAPETLIGLEVVTSAEEATPDENVSYTVRVVNGWDQGINQVVVADFVPAGMTYLSGSASQGTVINDRGLVWAELGPMAPGASATVTIMVRVNGDVEPGTVIPNTISAYHSDNAAVQARAAIKVVEYTNGVLPVTGLAPFLPFAGLFLGGMLFLARKMRQEGV